MKTTTYDETQWRLVPIEPTTEMLEAGSRAADLYSRSTLGIWFDVLAAAPTPPAVEQPSAQDREDAERYRWLKANIKEEYELPGGYYIPDEDTDSWNKTIDAARAAAKEE
jgi:hypothetical protein